MPVYPFPQLPKLCRVYRPKLQGLMYTIDPKAECNLNAGVPEFFFLRYTTARFANIL